MNLQPSAEALKLAAKMSGHTFCQAVVNNGPFISNRTREACEECQANAATIDRDLQLPHRNAALLLAQTLVDAAAQRRVRPDYMNDIIDQLRDELADIKTKP